MAGGAAEDGRQAPAVDGQRAPPAPPDPAAAGTLAQRLLDSLPDALATVDPRGAVVFANHIARSLFRLRVGLSIADAGLPGLTDCHRRAVDSGAACHPSGYDAIIRVFDDQQRTFLPHAIPQRDAAGALTGVTLMLADVTDLRRLDRMKSNLLMVVSHALHAPLALLRVNTAHLVQALAGHSPASEVALADTLRLEEEGLQGIIDDLLDISRLRAGSALLTFSDARPEALMAQAVTASAGLAQERRITVTCAADRGMPVIRVDHGQLLRACSILVEHAVATTAPDGAVYITIQAGADRMVDFSVEDQGPTMHRGQHGTVFDYFDQDREPSTLPHLGLSIASEIVWIHGGRMWLPERQDAGNSICFTIPSGAASAGRQPGD